MSLATQVANLATRIGTEFKAVRATIGTLASLSTTDKGSLVGAVNEVRGLIGAAGAQINDTTAQATTVYSSTHTEARITAAVNGIIDSAPGTLDTLNELAAALGDDPNAVATINTALSNRLRFDAAQTLTAGQKTQGLANLGAAASTDMGDPATDFVATFVAALA